MSASTWGDRARQIIEVAALAIPESATLAERRAAIEAARPWDFRGHWPTRAWAKARNAYLAGYGYRPRRPRGSQIDLFDRDPATGRPVIP